MVVRQAIGGRSVGQFRRQVFMKAKFSAAVLSAILMMAPSSLLAQDDTAQQTPSRASKKLPELVLGSDGSPSRSI
jgi:hypothetical protein